MTCYVHIGIGKTGTTSIQSFLFQHRDLLHDKGYVYPSAGLLGAAHYGFFDLQTSELTHFSFDNLASELLQHAAKHFVISSENLAFAPAPAIDRLLQVLGSDTRIIFYVREQIGLISSVFLQWLKDGWDYRGSIENFLDEHQASFNYAELIRPWVERFGADRIVAHVYDPAIVGSNVTEHFLRVVGIEGLAVADERHNPSLLPEFFAAIKGADEAGIDQVARRALIEGLLEASVKLVPCSTMDLFSPAIRERIRQYYSDSNQEFAERFLPPLERAYLLAAPLRV